MTSATFVLVLLCTSVVVVVGATSAGAVVLLGTIAVAGAVAFGVSRLRRPSHASTSSTPGLGLANSLILIGTIPSLAFFWIVLPAIVAVAVIVGVLTSDRSLAATSVGPASG